MPKSLPAPRLAAWRGLLTVHANIIAAIEERLAAKDLPPLGWYDVLFALYEQPDRRLRMSELAKNVLLSRSGLTRLTDRLEAEGYVRREACSTDKRGLHVVLTEDGRQVLRRMWPTYQQGIFELFSRHLDDDDVEHLRGIWEKLTPSP